MNIIKKRDRNGDFHGSYLGDNGKYYPHEKLFDDEGNKLFDFTIVEMTQSEIDATAVRSQEVELDNKLYELRSKRDELIVKTDWWASSDLTMTAEQTAYRQALRDITNTYTSLEDVVWPTKP